MAPIKVDPNGDVFLGLAVTFGYQYVTFDPASGQVVAEQFDLDSFSALPEDIPLLVGHNRAAAPIGIVRKAGLSVKGLAVEGQLLGSSHEIESWRSKFAAGVYVGLSVGFMPTGRQQYRRPDRRGDPLGLVRRGVIVQEISLTSWPAYPEAGIVRISEKTAAAEDAGRELTLAEHDIAEAARFLARPR